MLWPFKDFFRKRGRMYAKPSFVIVTNYIFVCFDISTWDLSNIILNKIDMSIDLNILFNLFNFLLHFSFTLRKNVDRLLGKFVKKN